MIAEPAGRNPYRIKTLLCGLMLLTICHPAVAEELTLKRIKSLPEHERPAWAAYMERSVKNAAADAAALSNELSRLDLPKAIKPPSGGNFKPRENETWYAGPEAERLAESILSYQTPSGGWSKHTDYSKGPRQPGMQWTSQNEPGRAPHYLGTFDNGGTTEEIYFLEKVWKAKGTSDCSQAIEKAVRYILMAQYPNGGWPQVYPLEGDYHDNITYNDDAMARILEMLYAISRENERFSFLEKSIRTEAAKAFERGVQCVLKSQFLRNGKKTAWCAQHDPLTLAPAGARAMEPAALSGVESAHIIEFLMRIRTPGAEIVDCIENAITWLEEVKVTGMRRTKVGEKTTYVPDDASTEVYWARFYDLQTNKPVFPGRDGVVYETFAEMAARNQVGYDYYSTQPGSILKNGQKKWRKMLADTQSQAARQSPK